uniref:Uncharacterized protein n=1 Tax=Oryza nivara TaxID=4536 RepID=A0A0E0I9E4_ORYNI
MPDPPSRRPHPCQIWPTAAGSGRVGRGAATGCTGVPSPRLPPAIADHRRARSHAVPDPPTPCTPSLGARGGTAVSPAHSRPSPPRPQPYRAASLS